jgi:hypothetical protein
MDEAKQAFRDLKFPITRTNRELAGRDPVFEVEDCFLLPIPGEEGVSTTKGRGRLDELLLSAPRQGIFRWQHCRG